MKEYVSAIIAVALAVILTFGIVSYFIENRKDKDFWTVVNQREELLKENNELRNIIDKQKNPYTRPCLEISQEKTGRKIILSLKQNRVLDRSLWLNKGDELIVKQRP
jgi:hypothetical protein